MVKDNMSYGPLKVITRNMKVHIDCQVSVSRTFCTRSAIKLSEKLPSNNQKQKK